MSGIGRDAGLVGRGLSHRYARKDVLNGIDLHVEAYEIVGLLGPNGAGKTTAMRLLAGLLPLRAGSVYLNGQDVSRYPLSHRARLGLGYLPQESSVFRRLSVGENIDLALQEGGVPSRLRAARRSLALDRLELTALSGALAETLSGGERRRLEIARALALEPRVLLLDEPFAGLDPLAVGRLKNDLRALAGEGLGILVTDHNIREILSICHRATILREGEVLREGRPMVLAEDPMVREHFLGRDFRLDTA